MKIPRLIIGALVAVSLAGCAVPPAVGGEGGGSIPADSTSGAMLAASGSAVVREASSWLGVPYVWGGNTRNGIDCSGLVKAVLTKLGMNVPWRVADDQARHLCSPVSLPAGSRVSALRPGDIVAFSKNGGGNYHHISIYVGNGNIIHAPIPGDHVRVAPINTFNGEAWAARRCAVR